MRKCTGTDKKANKTKRLTDKKANDENLSIISLN